MLKVCFDPELLGSYSFTRPHSNFWSDCCVFHSLIPPNASLPSLIHLCQWLKSSAEWHQGLWLRTSLWHLRWWIWAPQSIPLSNVTSLWMKLEILDTNRRITKLCLLSFLTRSFLYLLLFPPVFSILWFWARNHQAQTYSHTIHPAYLCLIHRANGHCSVVYLFYMHHIVEKKHQGWHKQIQGLCFISRLSGLQST